MSILTVLEENKVWPAEIKYLSSEKTHSVLISTLESSFYVN